MTLIIYDDTRTFTNVAYTIGANDTLMLTQRAQMILNLNYNGGPSLISSAGTVDNAGYIFSNEGCISLTGSGSYLVNTGTIKSVDRQNSFYDLIAVASGTSSSSAASNPNTIENHGTITATGNNNFTAGVLGNGYLHVTNSGLISQSGGNSNSAAIYANGLLNLSNSGTITTDFALNAIYMQNGSAVITNIGVITGALSLYSGNDTISNSGKIVGSVNLDYGTNVVTNHGLIDGSISGLGANTIVNDGTITGSLSFATDDTNSGNAADAVQNEHGTILGDVNLGFGNDTLDNTYGTVTGGIIGGLGNDTVNGGAQRDVIYGDDLAGTNTAGGADSLFGFYGDDVIHGGFGNDTIQGNQGNDVLYGDAGNDFLHGGQDSDQLYGGDGDDILNGGLGADVLTGGAGNDTFTYALNFGHDTITDFSAVSGNNDTIRFQAGTFANYADVQSHMEQQGANVVIELNVNDSLVLANTTTAALTSDHFIFG